MNPFILHQVHRRLGFGLEIIGHCVRLFTFALAWPTNLENLFAELTETHFRNSKFSWNSSKRVHSWLMAYLSSIMCFVTTWSARLRNRSLLAKFDCCTTKFTSRDSLTIQTQFVRSFARSPTIRKLIGKVKTNR